MKMLCPTCGKILDSGEINREKGVAMCGRCEEFFPLARIEEQGALEAFDPAKTPTGCWYASSPAETRIGVSLRNCMALFLVPFTLVWGGGSLGGIYGSQIATGNFSIVLSLFGLPFLLGTLFLVSITSLMVAGKTEIRLRGDEGEIFTGVGPIGRRRSFRLSACRDVTLDARSGPGRRRGRAAAVTKELVVVADEEIRLGAGLSEETLQWMLLCLKKHMAAAPVPGTDEVVDAEWESL